MRISPIDPQVIEAFKKRLDEGKATTSAQFVAQNTHEEEPDEAPKYNKSNPFSAAVLARVNLNSSASAKKTVHLELSLRGSGIQHRPGDSLGVVPRNAPNYVRELIAAAHLERKARVTVDGQEIFLVDALGELFDITTVTRPFVMAYAAAAPYAELACLLEKGQEEKFQRFAHGREIIDVLQAFPPGDLAPQAWVSMLRRLRPRLYSISSSLLAHKDVVHLLVGLTRYESHGRKREGVCSGFICERLGEGEPLRVFLLPNPRFRLPADPDARVIMIGPGTGVAPFRAFLEEREALGCRGCNWLFFGNQHSSSDFLYQVDWQRWHKSGLLSDLSLAFSRDQPEKLYVQHRMIERARDVYAWLQDGAHLYVCGDAAQMAIGVHEALISIVAKEGGKDRDAAVAYVQALQAEKRYVRNVY